MTQRLMIRRVAATAVALTFAALLGGAWPTPASAAPTRPVTAPTGLCTTDEWRNPTKWAECADRAAGTITDQVDCRTPPAPDSPDAGLAGWFTQRTDEDIKGAGVPGLYTVYGQGGYQVSLYDVGTPPLCGAAHPVDEWQSQAATQVFGLAAGVVAVANETRILAYDPARMWGWSDPAVRDVTDALYRHVFLTLGMLALAAVGLILIATAHRGDTSRTVQIVGWAVLVLVAVTAVGQYPLRAVHGTDRAAAGALSMMHAVTGPAPQSLPPSQCALPDPTGCVDTRSTAVRAADTITKQVLYRPWLRALLGSDTSPTAIKYGPVLYDASTMSWAETSDITKHPEMRAVIIAQKARHWQSAAAEIKLSDPAAYENLQGLHGGTRLWDAFLALFLAVIYTGFDLAASVVILVGFAVIRFALMLLPLVAAVGIVEPASGPTRRLANAIVVSVFNIAFFAAFAGLYLTFVDLVTSVDTIPGPVQAIAVLLAGAAAWLMLRPARKLGAVASLHIRTRARAGDADPQQASQLADTIRRAATTAVKAYMGGLVPGPATTTTGATVAAARTHGAGPGPGGERLAITARPETRTGGHR